MNKRPVPVTGENGKSPAISFSMTSKCNKVHGIYQIAPSLLSELSYSV